MVAESAIFKDRVEVECPYLPTEGTEKEVDGSGQDLFFSARNFGKSYDDSFDKTKVEQLEISAGWRKLAELCDESNKKAVESEEWKAAQKISNLEMSHSINKKPRDKGARYPSSSSADSEIKKKVRNELYIPLPVSNNIDVASNQIEKCVDDKGAVQNTKSSSKSLTEREIESLFENSHDQNCRKTQKADEWKYRDAASAASARENKKGSEEGRDEISGDEGVAVEYCQSQVSTKFGTEKKKRKGQRQKSVGGDFACDLKISAAKKKHLEETYGNSPARDSDQQVDSSFAGSSPLCKTSEQCKKQEKFKKLEEDREEARVNAEKKKKEKEFLMKKEREEIERQKREVEEKEVKRAAERERKRREEEEREAREREQREKRRKEREDREKLKKIKEKEDKSGNSSDLRKQGERCRDGKSKKELKSVLLPDSRSDEANESTILDRLFGDGDGLKAVVKKSDKEEAKRKSEENRAR